MGDAPTAILRSTRGFLFEQPRLVSASPGTTFLYWKGIFIMKKQFLTAAVVLTLGANAQVSGPSSSGAGSSASGASPASSSTASPSAPKATAPKPLTASPQPGALTSPQPQTSLGTPNATAGATEPFQPGAARAIRPNGSINDSRDWERSAGAPASGEIGEESRGRLTPPPDIVQPVRPLTGRLSTTTPGASPGLSSDLNTSGINTPARVPEQPLDRAMSAKIRSQLSLTPGSLGTVPRTGDRATTISPETVRDLRITSSAGSVVLEGTVNSQAERVAIEAQARRVQGVGNIENRLTVRNPSPVGAPGAVQSGQSQQLPSLSTGQTPQKATDLRNESRELSPDH